MYLFRIGRSTISNIIMETVDFIYKVRKEGFKVNYFLFVIVSFSIDFNKSFKIVQDFLFVLLQAVLQFAPFPIINYRCSPQISLTQYSPLFPTDWSAIMVFALFLAIESSCTCFFCLLNGWPSLWFVYGTDDIDFVNRSIGDMSWVLYAPCK